MCANLKWLCILYQNEIYVWLTKSKKEVKGPWLVPTAVLGRNRETSEINCAFLGSIVKDQTNKQASLEATQVQNYAHPATGAPVTVWA